MHSEPSAPVSPAPPRRVSFSDELGDLLAEDLEGLLSSSSAVDGCHDPEAASRASSRSATPTRSILRRPSYTEDCDVRFENLAVKMGLLKCGHVFQTAVKLPNAWKDGEGQEEDAGGSTSSQEAVVEARVAEFSADPDLHAAIDASSCLLTLSARDPGKYLGRVVVELTRRTNETCAEKCLLSLQVDATIMQPNMGNPRLRRGVVCLGEMEGYFDSEENRPTPPHALRSYVCL